MGCDILQWIKFINLMPVMLGGAARLKEGGYSRCCLLQVLLWQASSHVLWFLAITEQEAVFHHACPPQCTSLVYIVSILS